MASGVNRRKNFIHTSSGLERWILPALVLSLLLHVALSFWAARLGFFQPSVQKVVFTEEPSFHLASVSIDPKVPELDKQTQQASLPQPVNLPEEKPSLGSISADTAGLPQAPSISKKLLTDKPDLPDAAKNALASSFPAIDQRSNLLEKQLLSEKPNLAPQGADGSAQTALRATLANRQGPATGDKSPGFSNLDDLLAQTGPLQPETAPILMPTDVLFDYDQDALLGGALGSLQKLGTLIQRNPNATFLIEGHSDSFGSDEYNLVLSQRRAESVKAWLVQNMNLDPSRISTKGYGKTRMLAPATGTIEQQALNRRVEIVIRAPRTP